MFTYHCHLEKNPNRGRTLLSTTELTNYLKNEKKVINVFWVHCCVILLALLIYKGFCSNGIEIDKVEYPITGLMFLHILAILTLKK
jgi:hypothetical protein